MTSDLVSRVRLTREAFDIERCHTHPHSIRYSVGHHSAGVAQLVIQCWMFSHDGSLPRAELIAAALHHDAPEVVTGDIPSPVKPMMSAELEMAEGRVLGFLWQEHQLETEEQEYLAAADAVELYLWCMDEVHQRSNLVFESWLGYYESRWERLPLPLPFQIIVLRSKHLLYKRTPWSTLKEIAGL